MACLYRRWRRVLTLPVLLLTPLLALAGAAGAQELAPAAPCDTLPVSSVNVDADRPQFRGAFAWWRKVARSLGLHHETTANGLVRRFVSLDPGLACTEFRRSESERILRAQPYLRDATVITTRVGDSVRVDVSTVDEVPVVASARLRGAHVNAFSLGTMNFLGAGMHVEGRWEQQRGRRQGFGGKVTHPQLLGRPYALLLEGMRRSLGEHYTASLSHPYYTDLQRIAWHAGYSILKDYAHLRRPDDTELLQPVDRAMWNVGGVIRVGPPRRLFLIGGMFLGERIVPRHEFSEVDSLTGRLIPTTDTAGTRRYQTYDATHAAGVLGIRALTYSRMKGLDALAAEQDVATGTQIGAIVGVQPWFRNPLQEAFALIDAYGAGRTRRTFIGARAEVESRVDLQSRDWKNLIASGRAAWYFQPRNRWVSELSVEGAGGWRTVVPYQLELGDRRGGLRGYARSREPGARRLLARFEQRLDLGRVQGTRAAYGAALFSDVGRMWAGDVPFGMDTPVRSSIGVALLAAVPARSQRTVRAELAIPTTRGEGARPELRFTVRETARGFWFEPPRIRWARLSAVPEQIFAWP
jgi:hypothetical protein